MKAETAGILGAGALAGAVAVVCLDGGISLLVCSSLAVGAGVMYVRSAEKTLDGEATRWQRRQMLVTALLVALAVLVNPVIGIVAAAFLGLFSQKLKQAEEAK